MGDRIISKKDIKLSETIIELEGKKNIAQQDKFVKNIIRKQ